MMAFKNEEERKRHFVQHHPPIPELMTSDAADLSVQNLGR
jgi:hypothetical protein